MLVSRKYGERRTRTFARKFSCSFFGSLSVGYRTTYTTILVRPPTPQRKVSIGRRAIILASASGVIHFAGGPAGKWLAEFFGPTNNENLPPEIRRWLRQRSRWDGSLVARKGKARLSLKRQSSYSSKTINLLLEKIESSDSNWLRRQGPLTPRELEVLSWLERGKTNADIAAILNIRPATVGKHLEHIYPKLGVENRTAAASFAPQLLGSHLNI